MSDYRYRDVPLTASVFAELILEMVEPGTTTTRAALLELIPAEHERRGGAAFVGAPTGVAKKALQDLQRQGLAETVTYRHWRILDGVTEGGMRPETVDEPVALGDGDQSVYVYYFPAYRDQAAHLGRDTWPMKVGMTTTPDVDVRLRDQCGTAMPERPIVGLLYRTANARSAEKMLHSVLSERGRHLTDAPGSEWFMTSLSEVRGILDFVTGGH